jgi:hypothetical protein
MDRPKRQTSTVTPAKPGDYLFYLMNNMQLLPLLENIDKFKEDVLKSYIKVNEGSYQHLLDTYEQVREREAVIYAEAKSKNTVGTGD